MKKNFFAAALILSLGVGSFAACSSDDVPVNPTEQKKTTTMMSIALKMPAASGTRAATDQPYNYIGEWLGQEKVNRVEVFVFNGTAGTSTLEAHETFNNGDYSAGVVGNEVVFRPNKGIAVTPGAKQVYVVVNSNSTTQAHLASVSTLGTTTLANFELKYNGVASASAAATGVATAVSATDNSAAGEFAKLDKMGNPTTPSAWKNEIVMTGDNAGTTGVTIADNVAEATAIAGGSNLVALTVKRVVARVAVTSRANSFTLSGDDPYNPGTNVTLGTVSDFTYVVAQGERTLNFKQKAGADATSNDGVGKIYNWTSPANAFVSTGGYSTANDPIAAAAMDKYDYAPLWQKPASSTNLLMGHPVPTQASLDLSAGDDKAKAIGELMEGNFVLPTTHNYNAAAPDGTQNGYYKGNTAYILIRTKFVPEKINMDLDPTVAATGNTRPNRPATVQPAKTWASITNPADRPEILVRGANGMFYNTVFASQDPIYNGVTGQTVEIFQAIKNGTGEVQGYKMLYFAWVNPDNVGTSKWYNSPVYRNNIYHVQLDGVTGTGTSWNPLVPATGGGTGVPSNDPNHPNNPDTFTPIPQVNVPTVPGGQTPVTPVTPVTPTPTPTPVQPQNPLTPNKTFMAVKTTVLPWQVHGYKFNLHNQ